MFDVNPATVLYYSDLHALQMSLLCIFGFTVAGRGTLDSLLYLSAL